MLCAVLGNNPVELVKIRIKIENFCSAKERMATSNSNNVTERVKLTIDRNPFHDIYIFW